MSVKHSLDQNRTKEFAEDGVYMCCTSFCYHSCTQSALLLLQLSFLGIFNYQTINQEVAGSIPDTFTILNGLGIEPALAQVPTQQPWSKCHVILG